MKDKIMDEKNKEQSIGIVELLVDTDNGLREKSKMIGKFGEIALTEIANDSDWHRSRKGFMGYEEYNILELKNGLWVVSRGYKCGSYPGDEFIGDIIAIRLMEKNADATEIGYMIRQGSYFQNTVIVGMAGGQIGTNGNVHGKILERMLPRQLNENILADAVVEQGYIDLNLNPIYKSRVQYKKGFGEVLSKVVIEALEKE